MWKEIILIVFTLAVVAFAVGFFYSQFPGEPVNLEVVENGDIEEENVEVNYGVTPVFSENLRFNHNLISYYIEPDCPEAKVEKMKEAFIIFHDKVNIISFYESGKEKADILVGCSKDYVETGNGMFIAGEGGPSKYLNGSLFDIILEGKITLYQESECDYPVVELHELLHVFGFDHINNLKSIMYNVSRCDQKITDDIVDTLNSLYEIEPLPDVYIPEVSAVKKRYYLDFNITVKNQGLVDAGDVVLTISSEGGEFMEKDFGNITLFGGSIWNVRNSRLPSRHDEEITFNVSMVSGGKEIDMNNNVVVLGVGD